MSTTEIVERPQASNQQVATQKHDASADASPEWRQILREAEKLAVATLTPKHLKVDIPPANGTPERDSVRRAAWQQTVANCILVANQAAKWKADVFAVAAESYVVANRLGYQGKLIAAVVNARGGLATPLRAIHSKTKGDAFAAVIYGSKTVDLQSLSKEEKKGIFALLIRYADSDDQEANRDLAMEDILAVRVSVAQCKTFDKNGQVNKQWTSDPEQKLTYTGTTKWARRYAPELMVGILSDDDLDRIKSQEQLNSNAQQARIESIIPTTLDSLPPPSMPQQSSEPEATDQEPPFNPPTDQEQSEAKEILQREEQADSRDTEDNAIALENWCREVKQADSVLDVQGLENQAENVPAAVRSRFVEACLERKTEIRKQRGGRA